MKRQFSEEHRKNISLSKMGNKYALGRKPTAETRAKISKALKGRQFSEEHRRKIGETSKGRQTFLGRTHTDEAKKKMSEAHKGRKFSDERRALMSEYSKGRVITEESRAKTSATLMGHHVSEETRKRISDSHGGKNTLMRTPYYVKIHRWVVKELGKPSICEFCKTTDAKQYDWSNKSQQYLYDLNDWQRLCRKCHSNYDIAIKTGRLQ